MYQRNDLPDRTDIGLLYTSPHEDYTLDLSLLFAVVEAARCHPYSVGKRLSQAVASITAGGACLSFHLPARKCSEPYITGSKHFLVQYEGYVYGTLCVAVDKQTGQPRLFSSVAEQLAKTCGIIINAVEKEVFVQFQARRTEHCSFEVLTAREREVLMCMGQGYNQHEIARLLHISPATVATYRQRIYAKWGVNRPLSAVLTGHEAGLFVYLAETT